jgi:hypothetical protein
VLLVLFLLSFENSIIPSLLIILEMATKDITVNGEVFPCPNDWTVDEAKAEIRSFYVLAGGGLQEGGVPLLGTQRIRDTAGALSFVGGKQIQQGKSAGSCCILDLTLTPHNFFSQLLHQQVSFQRQFSSALCFRCVGGIL